jgi:uncharacterized membrane protein
MHFVPRALGKVGVLTENTGAALAYFTFIPAIVLLLRDPYKRNAFLRFHSVQCLLLWTVSVIAAAAIRLADVFLFMIPVAGPLFAVLISGLCGLAAFVTWLVLVVKALQGERFKLPVLGDVAERYESPK